MIQFKILGVALLLALALAGIQTFRLASEQTAHAETVAEHAIENAERESEARLAVENARAEEKRRADALQGVINEAEHKLEAARADASDASDAGERLRQRLAAITATCRVGASNPGSAAPGATAGAAGDMLADVQRRIDEATDGVAKFADKARTAGAACERSYRQLTAP